MSSRKGHEVLFVADAGPQVGWGNYIRSRALAGDLAAAGASVHFYVRGVMPKLSTEKSPVGILNQDVSDFLLDRAGQAQVVILDLFEFSSEILKSLEPFPVSVCINDGNDLLFNCDLLVNPNVNEEFTHHSVSRTKYMSGEKHILLRPQFEDVSQRRCKEGPVRLFIAFGGTDPAHLTPWIIRFLKGTEQLPVQRITVLVGDDGLAPAVRNLAHGDQRFHILHGMDDVCSLLKDADVGIISAGTTLYEAAVTGLPVLVVSLNESQAREARAFQDKGAAVYLGDAVTLNGECLVKELKGLTGREVRQRMSEKAQALVDGQGRKRVAEAILELAVEKLGNA